MEDTNQNYQALKKNIKDFIRTQNVDKKKRWGNADLYSYGLFIYIF